MIIKFEWTERSHESDFRMNNVWSLMKWNEPEWKFVVAESVKIEAGMETERKNVAEWHE